MAAKKNMVINDPGDVTSGVMNKLIDFVKNKIKCRI